MCPGMTLGEQETFATRAITALGATREAVRAAVVTQGTEKKPLTGHIPISPATKKPLQLVLREALVGMVNGLAFAIITGVAAVAWFRIPGLGVVIGLAMVCNLVAGALGGILVPMVLDRVRADPAVASGTFVTTITDVVGFFSFLGIATLWFGLK